VPEVVDELDRMEDVAARCTLFITATAARAKTARLTKWANIDFVKREWTPPFADLKEKHHKRPFIVPLNDVALDVLERMRARTSSRYVFAHSTGGPISEDAITCLVRKLRRRRDDWRDPDSNRPFTVHGFRASLKTWTREAGLDRKIAPHIPTRELAELILGHRIGTDVERAYDRSDLLEARREIMGLWARHCLGAVIIAFPNARP
jgi:integrase